MTEVEKLRAEAEEERRTWRGPGCEECGQVGYVAMYCDGNGHPPVELQCCDNCCARVSTTGDDEAALRFVRDLEAGGKWAHEQLCEIVDPALILKGLRAIYGDLEAALVSVERDGYIEDKRS